MRITEVEALLLRQPGAVDESISDGSQDALVVRVHTDGASSAGRDRLPAARREGDHRGARLARDRHAAWRAIVIGEDPLDIDAAWRRMFAARSTTAAAAPPSTPSPASRSRSGTSPARRPGKPIHELLGGAAATDQAYASTLMPETPDERGAAVAAQRRGGLRRASSSAGGRSAATPTSTSRWSRRRARPAATTVELMIDVGFGWSDARRGDRPRPRGCAGVRPYWIEEPFWPDEYGSYRALADAVDTPIAAGEEETTVWDFERLIDRGGVAVVQPDVTRAGGMRECLRIAELARRGAAAAACSTRGAPASSRPRACTCSPRIEEAEYFEYCVQTTELNQRLVAERFEVVDGDGRDPDGGRPRRHARRGRRPGVPGRMSMRGGDPGRGDAAPVGAGLGLLEQAERLDVRVGGAESNVAVALARLGRRTAWSSALPDNPLGRRVAGAVAAAGVDVAGVRTPPTPGRHLLRRVRRRAARHRGVLRPRGQLLLTAVGVDAACSPAPGTPSCRASRWRSRRTPGRRRWRSRAGSGERAEARGRRQLPRPAVGARGGARRHRGGDA